MFSFEVNQSIQRPIEQVFEYVSNPGNDAQWRESVVIAEWSSDPPYGAGSTQRWVDKFLGRNIESRVEITYWDPPNGFGYRMLSGPVPFESSIQLVPQNGGTQLTAQGQADFKGVFRLAEVLVRKQLENLMSSEFRSLKAVMERAQ